MKLKELIDSMVIDKIIKISNDIGYCFFKGIGDEIPAEYLEGEILRLDLGIDKYPLSNSKDKKDLPYVEATIDAVGDEKYFKDLIDYCREKNYGITFVGAYETKAIEVQLDQFGMEYLRLCYNSAYPLSISYYSSIKPCETEDNRYFYIGLDEDIFEIHEKYKKGVELYDTVSNS